MKKILSLLMVAMLAFNAWAAEESIELTAAAQDFSNEEVVTTVQGDVVTLTFDKANSNNNPTYYSNGDAVRLYSGATMTVSAGDNTITKVVFVYELIGTATVTVTPGTYDASSKTWTGSASEVVMTAGTAKHVRISKVTVTYGEGDTPVETVTPPTFSPAAGEVEAGTAVTLSAPADKIVYTTDETTPSYANNNGKIYTEPIVVNEAMTIMAIAVDANGNESEVATATYTIKTAAQIATVTLPYAESFQSGLGDFYINDVVGVAGSEIWNTGSYNETYYVKATSYINKTNNDAESWLISPYINMEGATNPQLTFSHAINAFFNAVEDDATLWVKEKDANDWTQIEITYPEKPAKGYSDFLEQTVDLSAYAGKTIQVAFKYVGHSTGSGTWEVAEFNVENVEAPVVAAPVITGETPFIGSTTVTITCEAQNATVYYTIDGTEPTNQSTEYTAPFELNESATVKAIAYDVTGATSTVSAKEFEKTFSVATVAEALALEQNTEFVFTGNLVVSAQNGKYLYAQDETGGVLIYGTVTPAYTKGDVIPAGFSAKTSVFKGAPQFGNPAGLEAATATAEIEAEAITPAEVSVDPYNLYKYNVIKGATITTGEDGKYYLTVDEDNVVVYDRFNVEIPADLEKTYDVYGIAGWYDGAQFMPLEFVEAVEPVVESFISYTAQQEHGTVAVVLEDGTPVESLVTKVAEGAKFTVTATAAQGYVVTNIEVKAGEIVITPTTDPYDEEFGAPALKAEGASEMSQTFTMPASDVAINVTFDVKTGIDTINMNNVKAVRYFNAAGVESAAPFQGVNIVVREMNDGSKVTTKVVK